MNISIISNNLRRLRRQKGLTQADLASKARITRLAYSNIETAKAEPRTSTLQQLAEALEVKLLDLINDTPILQKVRFRASKKLHREQILATVSNWLSDRNYLETQIELTPPANSIAEFKASVKDLNLSPRALAAEVRKEWKLDERQPISNICGRLESWGIKVLPQSFQSDRFFGLAVGPMSGGPAIAVNVWDRISVERWIFSAAHELGHILLHDDAFDVAMEDEDPKEEREANEFAGHLLIPDNAFLGAWKQASELGLIDKILSLKRQFLVSWKTIAYRLCEHLSGKKKNEIWPVCYQGFKKMGLRVGGHDEVDPSRPEAFSELMRADEPANLHPNDFIPSEFGGPYLRELVMKAIKTDAISVSRGAAILQSDIPRVRQLFASWCQENSFQV